MSNSNRLNTAFRDLSELLGLQFETINGFDRIDEGADKVVRNLEAIAHHLPSQLLVRPKDTTIDGSETEA